MPNFEQFIEAASKILPHQTKADALKRLDDLYPEVDEEGQKAIKELQKLFY
ncbi:hypothetical protein KBC03_02190 [Patescibacteria group bacterium]|nr:hypothetical protein [Patescibacteria group bacterium]